MSNLKPGTGISIGKDVDTYEEKNSMLTRTSYGLGGFFDNIYSAAFSVRVIAFYEDEVLLPILLVSIAFVLYGVWNMFNDPLLGHLSDRKNRFTQKYGRRFPWFVASAIPFTFIYLFIFTVPFNDTILIFIWLLITICLYDFLYSIWDTNWLALFPEKFRSVKERAKVGGITTVLGLVGMTAGMLIPPLFIVYGDRESYIISAMVVVIIGLLVALLMIPGMRETEEMKQKLLLAEEKQGEDENFFQYLKIGLKQKNLLVYFFLYITMMVLFTLILGSLPYLVRYILKMPADTEIYISAAFLIGSVSSVPVWVYLSLKLGNRKVYMIGFLFVVIALIPLLFVSTLSAVLLSILVLGFAVGAVYTLVYPVFSDVIDEIVVQTGKRNEGIFTGLRTFFGRTANIIAAIVFVIVHELTFYQPGAESQAPLALWGIRVILALVPMVFFLLSFILLWKVYDLTPLKVKENQEELIKINL